MKMKNMLSILLSVLLLLSLAACGENIEPAPEKDDNISQDSANASPKPKSEVIACSYAEFRPCIIDFDKTKTVLSYEKIDTKKQIDAFVARYEEAIAEDYARFEGVAAALEQTKAMEEEAKKIFVTFTEAFFEQNVLYLIALPVSAVKFDLANVKVQTEPDKGQLTIDVSITNIESTGDADELQASTVAVWIDRDVAQAYGENVVITRINV